MKEQTDDITRGVEAADWVAGSIEHLGALVDLQAAEGEGNTAGDRIRPVGGLIERTCPIGFLWCDAFGAFAVQLSRIERNILAHSFIELFYRVIEHGSFNTDLARQFIDAICDNGCGKLISGAEQWNGFLIVDLIRHRSWLAEHRPTRLGIGV